VISVLLYGRNDSHGYNLHRRAALSLNCIAEVLTCAGDEIIFVDYNTPDELPTFIEAIADTLTDACLGMLRVLRVPAAIHEERFASRTDLPAIEPVARNAAARRSNPSNRWLLSTNTDMIFVPLADRSLSEICEQLADGFYGLPRFELPEWLWEGLPRSDPRRAMTEVERYGPRLRLDEPTVSWEWIRFDAPGDFQLVLRDDLFAIHGYDEEMLLGWHVDSNFSRRMCMRRDAIESLGDQVGGYHCNHSRVPSIYQGRRVISNDAYRYVFSIPQPELVRQRESWGLNGSELEEVPLGRPREALAETIARAIGDDPGTRATYDARRADSAVTYDSGHVLPFVADSLVLLPPNTTIAYLGVNPIFERMLTALVADLGQRHLVVAQLEDEESLAALDQAAHLFVIDLGVDRSLVDDKLETSSVRMPLGLDLVYEAFTRCVELERARIRAGTHARRFVLINSKNSVWDAYVMSQLDCSYETHHSRVRNATVKESPIRKPMPARVIDYLRAKIGFRRHIRRFRARYMGGPAVPDHTVHVP